MKKNKKGFTLVEVLTVVVILGILVAAIIGSISVYVKKGKDTYNNELEDQSILSSKNYFTDYPKDLKNGYITFKELASRGFLSKDFIDAYGNDCMENSYVTVKRKDKNKELTLNNIEYHACIKCGEGGYTNIKNDDNDCKVNTEGSDPDTPNPPPINTINLTINVENGTINNKNNNTYNINPTKNYEVPDQIEAEEGYTFSRVSCDGQVIGVYNAKKLKVNNIQKNTTCTVKFNKEVKGKTIIRLHLFDNDTNVSIEDANSKETSIGDTATFIIKVPAPSDRYIKIGEVSCDKGVDANSNTEYNWKDKVNNSERIDKIKITNNSVKEGEISCNIYYKARWTGVPKDDNYTIGETIQYADKYWTVVEDKNNSVRLVLNGVASGSESQSYSNASNWLDTTWKNTQNTTLKTDRKNQGLLPLSGSNYFNTDSGTTTNLTDYSYYISSDKFYNNRTIQHYKLTKSAFVNDSYTLNEKFTSTIYNTGYSTDTQTQIGIRNLNSTNYYINQNNQLVFKNAAITSKTLSGYHTSRYMNFKTKKSISPTKTCEECDCTSTGTSGKERICYYRDKNYRTATISGGKVSYIEKELTDGYGYMGDGNKAVLDTEDVKFYLCGGSNHGKLLELMYNNASKYNWISPNGNKYNRSYSNNDTWRIAGNDITYCPKSGNESQYNGCKPKKTGVPHTRTYKANEDTSCKSKVKEYTLKDSTRSIYFRPQLEVRKR